MIVDFKNFPSEYSLSGNKNTNIELGDILKSSVSVASAYGSHKTKDEIKWRQHMILSYLEEIELEGIGLDIVRSKSFDSLDPSEKGGISFYLAMASTVAVAKKELGFKSIVHFDSLISFWRENNINSGVRIISGNRRPDLVGFKISRRHAQRANYQIERGYFECKGRSNRYDQNAMNSACRQLQNINDPDYSLRVASQFYFHGSMNSLRGRMIDPPSEDLFGRMSDQNFASSILSLEAMSVIKMAENDETFKSNEVGDRIVIFDDSDNEIEINETLYSSAKKMLSSKMPYREVREELVKLNDLIEQTYLSYPRYGDLISYEIKKRPGAKKTAKQYVVEMNSDLISYLNIWSGEYYQNSWVIFIEKLLIKYHNKEGTAAVNDTGVYQQRATPNLWSLKVLGRRVGRVKFKSYKSFEINLGFNENNPHLNSELFEYLDEKNLLISKEFYRGNKYIREPLSFHFNDRESFLESQDQIIEIIEFIFDKLNRK